MDNKTFIDELASRCGLDISKVSGLVTNLTDVISDVVAEDDSVAVPSFGSFEVKKRPERIVVHPSTGKKMLVPPKVSLMFKPSSILKQKIRQDKDE